MFQTWGAGRSVVSEGDKKDVSRLFLLGDQSFMHNIVEESRARGPFVRSTT